jgi:hypothetical protein
MGDLEAMARAIVDGLTSLGGIPVEALTDWHPASTDIFAEPEAMLTEHKDSIEALRDGRTNKRTRETQLLKSKSSFRYNTCDQPGWRSHHNSQ